MTEANQIEQTPEQIAAENLKREIKAKFNNLVDPYDVRFRFRKVKDEASGIESQRPAVELTLGKPSVEGIIAILQSDNQKSLDLLLEAVEGVITSAARDIVEANEDINQANFPLEQISWDYIANLPKAERRGGGIAKETWEDFVADYIEVMPGVTGKSVEQVTRAAKIYQNKFAMVKSNKPVLKKLHEQLSLYIMNTPRAEEFTEAVKFLTEKATTLLSQDDSKLLENL